MAGSNGAAGGGEGKRARRPSAKALAMGGAASQSQSGKRARVRRGSAGSSSGSQGSMRGAGKKQRKNRRASEAESDNAASSTSSEAEMTPAAAVQARKGTGARGAASKRSLVMSPQGLELTKTLMSLATRPPRPSNEQYLLALRNNPHLRLLARRVRIRVKDKPTMNSPQGECVLRYVF